MSPMLQRSARARDLRGLALRPPDPALVETIAAFLRVEWNVGLGKGRILSRDVLAIVDGHARAANLGGIECLCLPG